MRTHSEEEVNEGAGGRAVVLPKMTVELSSADTLNLTLTKSLMHIIMNIADDTKQLMNIVDQTARPLDDASLRFRNLLPIDLHVTSPINAHVKGGDDVALNVDPGDSIAFEVSRA